MYIHILFSHLRHKVYLRRRYGHPTCAVFFTRSSICRTQAAQILFCIYKARKRSFTEVVLNSVLEENAIDFAWEFAEISARYLFSSLTFLQTVYLLFFPNYLIGGSVQCNLIAYCVQCNAYFALCAHKDKCTVCASLHAPWVSDHTPFHTFLGHATFCPQLTLLHANDISFHFSIAGGVHHSHRPPPVSPDWRRRRVDELRWEAPTQDHQLQVSYIHVTLSVLSFYPTGILRDCSWSCIP